MRYILGNPFQFGVRSVQRLVWAVKVAPDWQTSPGTCASVAIPSDLYIPRVDIL